MRYFINLNDVNTTHVDLVGGKNASLGEMLNYLTPLGISVPSGYAATTVLYRDFIAQKNLATKIEKALAATKINKITSLEKTAKQIRQWIMATPFPEPFDTEIASVYAKLKNGSVAIRSSATAEDLATASFAGQQETFLNVRGLTQVKTSIKKVFASLYTARAIAYRHHHGFASHKIAISVGIQPMIRSDKGTSGVIFTLDTESGFDQVILITAAYGLGETIVQGQVNPDEFCVSKQLLAAKKFPILQRNLGTKAVKMVYSGNKTSVSTKTIPVSQKEQKRFCLSDEEIQKLAAQALLIEKHYGHPMDIEWAKDGLTGKLYIVQARPETVKSQHQHQVIEHYTLTQKGKVLTAGQSIGQRIGQGVARIIANPKNMHQLQPGEVLVTDMTDPDWEPIMKIASAIVTNRGGRTCHAAIIARELGIPAVVGCENATTKIKNKTPVTVSCAEGQQGTVYEGTLSFDVTKVKIENMPELPIDLCLNVGNPDRAFLTQNLPNKGVGLARLEFIISNMIGIHPNAVLNFSSLPKALHTAIKEKTAAYKNPVEYYVEKLREGISTLAAAFYPRQVIFRFSDFKTNEYANLLGGHLYEPYEENPMIGFRGASRYQHDFFKKCFALECKAFQRVRDKMGLTNAAVMVPFVRTVEELKQVLHLMEKYGLKRDVNELKVYMMCEVPSNALLADEFLKHVDGFSIGSNDLTQLTLGLDRDSSIVAPLFDERDQAVKILLQAAIRACKKAGKYIGICGQGPSDHPDFADWLMQEGIESISLNPDSILETWLAFAKKIEAPHDAINTEDDTTVSLQLKSE